MASSKKLILVDKKGKILGYKEEMKCHLGKGLLHRAFSIYIFNKKNELLLQKRSRFKMLWPLFWSNTCCSHPIKGENLRQTAKKRLKEEMGFSCPLRLMDRFYYYAPYRNIGSERELCYILMGRYNGKVKPNKKEAADWKWVNLKELRRDLKIHPNKYTPWFKIGLKRIEKWVNRCRVKSMCLFL